MRIAWLVLVLGCGGGSKQAAAPKAETPTCAAVADAMMAMMPQKEDSPKWKETADGFKAIIRTRCDADAWTAEAKTCLAAMKTREDAERCGAMLTEEQQANLVRDEKAKFGAPEAEPAMAPMNDEIKQEKAKEAPKRSKGSPKPGDPCDGGE